MVELVISLTIIGIVTLASIGIMTAQTKSNVVTVQTIEATNITENAIECFRYAVNVGGDDVKGTFKTAFEQSLDKTAFEQSLDEGVTWNETESGYEFTQNGLSTKFDFSASDGKDTINTITITVFNSSGDEIINETYTK